MTGDSRFLIVNDWRFNAAKAGTICDPRADVDDYPKLGIFEYGYDASSNALSGLQTGTNMPHLDADRYYDYDTLNRLLTARLKDNQAWSAASEVTTSYQYDDLGNRESHSYRDAALIAYEHDP